MPHSSSVYKSKIFCTQRLSSGLGTRVYLSVRSYPKTKFGTIPRSLLNCLPNFVRSLIFWLSFSAIIAIRLSVNISMSLPSPMFTRCSWTPRFASSLETVIKSRVFLNRRLMSLTYKRWNSPRLAALKSLCKSFLFFILVADLPLSLYMRMSVSLRLPTYFSKNSRWFSRLSSCSSLFVETLMYATASI